MGFSMLSPILLLSLFLCSLFPESAIAAKKSYVVLLAPHSHGSEVSEADLQRVSESHHQLLGSFLGSEKKAKKAIFYSYQNHINGFAAVLEEEEAAELARHPEVGGVIPDEARELHTTHSWEFMNLERRESIPSNSIWKKARFGEDTIIANLDTGVWPESKSFSEKGIKGPVPKRWKGGCENNTVAGVRCNRKLIGAKYYNKAYFSDIDPSTDIVVNSTRDYEGHGSHTLSTAAGNFVPGASVFGSGFGSAKGGSPKARIASYKVCWEQGCYTADIVKAFDDAIHDGVDVLSLSLGGYPMGYKEDLMAVAAFIAVKRGIPVVCSAGNSGPTQMTVTNTAPWIFTIGASTLDRSFEADLRLKNGKHFKGSSLSSALPENKMYPMIDAGAARAKNASQGDALLCKPGTLDRSKVKGKILVCLRGDNSRVEKGEQAAIAGAAGMILCNDQFNGYETVADPHVLPATHIDYNDGVIVFKYVRTTKNPMGYLVPPTAKLNARPAPTMAAFSSRGPNFVTPEIIKPDVTAPGVDIIAAYTGALSPTGQPFDKRKAQYLTMSGTSMSCPHVAGIVGLLKTMYPHWSPSAIKSAIMTTASVRDNTRHPIRDSGSDIMAYANPLDYGSGHVRPNAAMDPGLVYDLTPNDYLDFLCAIGYTQKDILPFAGRNYSCPPSPSIRDFNYPSFAIEHISDNATFTRKLKNVGAPGVYKARVYHPRGVAVRVEPMELKFEKVGEEKSFKLTLIRRTSEEFISRGTLIWSDGKHYVRSPILASSTKFSTSEW